MLPAIQLLAAGGGMYVEVFNRVTPLAYNIIKKNKLGETNTYLDGIYFRCTYLTKFESITPVVTALTAHHDIIRFYSLNIKKKYN
ncbi:unnamed protein product [Eruca vesicaria subsp. sativa]|uniref:Uncharacterized protein n=1 Tax=Eruca vesicaria subsp. sativa TaxID=29727 RepID=A0ABC8KMU8_ERUVS|nr:unnamed protein product [Eruca vesicaria subsp. sativa]